MLLALFQFHYLTYLAVPSELGEKCEINKGLLLLLSLVHVDNVDRHFLSSFDP